ncbi:hypothetical protein ACO2FP_10790 [Staphylococcus warneri]|uniref:hypothetical protein n=1 Tax=Staphylococcus TaxID=1279 RepID=UPI000EC9F5BF|nr:MULTISPECIES: hypothetical protein [Staphylococcus]MCI2788730.1 hypothetical protein [Staphylococcus warneri]QSF51204.1 hypothetical protein JX000_09370 [Staphylococcus sp. SB1-57]RQM97051.1 hypothetical protein CPA43_11430 [Staphylococcus warneri]HBY81948.1 hypothetical protein [Staphylococcus sp.]
MDKNKEFRFLKGNMTNLYLKLTNLYEILLKNSSCNVNDEKMILLNEVDHLLVNLSFYCHIHDDYINLNIEFIAPMRTFYLLARECLISENVNMDDIHPYVYEMESVYDQGINILNEMFNAK